MHDVCGWVSDNVCVCDMCVGVGGIKCTYRLQTDEQLNRTTPLDQRAKKMRLILKMHNPNSSYEHSILHWTILEKSQRPLQKQFLTTQSLI